MNTETISTFDNDSVITLENNRYITDIELLRVFGTASNDCLQDLIFDRLNYGLCVRLATEEEDISMLQEGIISEEQANEGVYLFSLASALQASRLLVELCGGIQSILGRGHIEALIQIYAAELGDFC